MMDFLTEKNEWKFLQATNHLRNRLKAGDAKAAYALSVYLNPHNEAIPLAWRKSLGASKEELLSTLTEAFRLLSLEADRGDGEAMHLIGQYYQTGSPPVSHSMEAFRDWCERAVAAGNLFAANDLYSIYAEPGSRFRDVVKARHYFNIIESAGVRVVR